jgi:hypothetical protein
MGTSVGDYVTVSTLRGKGTLHAARTELRRDLRAVTGPVKGRSGMTTVTLTTTDTSAAVTALIGYMTGHRPGASLLRLLRRPTGQPTCQVRATSHGTAPGTTGNSRARAALPQMGTCPGQAVHAAALFQTGYSKPSASCSGSAQLHSTTNRDPVTVMVGPPRRGSASSRGG